MTTEDYESRTDSVLAWKKTQKLGRFDPNAPEIEKSKIDASFKEVEDRGALHRRLANFSSNQVGQSQLTFDDINRHQARSPLSRPAFQRPPPRPRFLRRRGPRHSKCRSVGRRDARRAHR
jgi:hypothetical protein